MQQRVVETVLEFDPQPGGGVTDIEVQHFGSGQHGIRCGVGHSREQCDLDGAACGRRPGPLLEERVHEKAVELLAVVVGEVAVNVNEVRDGDIADGG